MWRFLQVAIALGFVTMAGPALAQDKGTRCQNYCQKVCASAVGTYKTVCASKCVTKCLNRR